MSTKIQALACRGLVLAGALSVGGCYARARVEPAYVETTYVPTHIHTYPSYRYDGRVVYLIDNRWYYRHSNGRWVYYREEPPVLYRQRTTIRQAPPAPRRVEPRPDPYRAPPPRHAPPAYYRDDRRDDPPPPKKRKRHDDRDYRDDDDRDRDGRRHDDGNHDHDHRDRY